MIRLGILSDTHGDIRMACYALLALRQRGAGFVVHCGDVGSVQIVEELAKSPSGFVFGNYDYPNPLPLAAAAERLGVHCFADFGEFEMGGLKFAVLHGDDDVGLKAIKSAQSHDIILQGHRHKFFDRQLGRTRVINPGALHRARELTCAMLHFPAGRLEKIIIN